MKNSDQGRQVYPKSVNRLYQSRFGPLVFFEITFAVLDIRSKYIFNGVLLFTNCCSHIVDTNWAATKLLHNTANRSFRPYSQNLQHQHLTYVQCAVCVTSAHMSVPFTSAYRGRGAVNGLQYVVPRARRAITSTPSASIERPAQQSALLRCAVMFCKSSTLQYSVCWVIPNRSRAVRGQWTSTRRCTNQSERW